MKSGTVLQLLYLYYYLQNLNNNNEDAEAQYIVLHCSMEQLHATFMLQFHSTTHTTRNASL